jgi:hypothetical protein
MLLIFTVSGCTGSNGTKYESSSGVNWDIVEGFTKLKADGEFVYDFSLEYRGDKPILVDQFVSYMIYVSDDETKDELTDPNRLHYVAKIHLTEEIRKGKKIEIKGSKELYSTTSDLVCVYAMIDYPYDGVEKTEVIALIPKE